MHGGALLSSAIDLAGTVKATGLTPGFVETCGVMVLLAHGFILTAMLWGGFLAFLIDRRIAAAAITLGAAALLALFGFIHSVLPTGSIYLPWQTGSSLPYQWASAYAALAVVLLVFSRVQPPEVSSER